MRLPICRYLGEDGRDEQLQLPVRATNLRSAGQLLTVWRWRRTLGKKKDFQLDAYYDQTSRHELNFGDVRNNFDVDSVDHLPLPRQEISWGAGN